MDLSKGMAQVHKKTLVVAPGLLVDLIWSDQYVDLTEIPPAKGPASKLLEVVVHPADLLQAKRIIPDLATWVQCFAVYAAVLLKKFPERSTSLLTYQKHLAY